MSAVCWFRAFSDPASQLLRSNTVNRRLVTFIVVFAAATAAGLIYTFSIPPTYIATATLQIDPPTTADQPQERAAFVATQTQVLASNDILEALVARLRDKQSILSGADTVPRLREMLSLGPLLQPPEPAPINHLAT